jgi:hypothetical protein
MPTSYPADRFDDMPHKLDRVGAHRAPAKKGRRWVGLWWALAVTALLIAAGGVGLATLNNRLNITIPGISAEATPEVPTEEVVPTAEPTLDPNASVTVLNGTPGIGVARGVGELLTEQGWVVATTSDASSEDIPGTTVYYWDAAQEGAARGVASLLPGATVELSDAYAASEATLTVVVGLDYVVPEGEPAPE